MPRQNPPRSIAGEHALARRIAHEREARGMSYEGLAVQMKHHGCPINSSALFRIEKGEPPRRITVEELLAFSRVFAKPVENLLLPPEVAAREALVDLLEEWELAGAKADEARERETSAWVAICEYLAAHPDVEPILEAALAGWAEHYYDESDRVAAVVERMFAATGSEDWLDRLQTHLATLGPGTYQSGGPSAPGRRKPSPGRK